MNDFDYARMIEIPVNTCDVTRKKQKRLWFKRPEALKQELIDAVNEQSPPVEDVDLSNCGDECEFADTIEITNVKEEKRKRQNPFKAIKGFKLDIITAQIAVVIVLALTVMLTNIFWQDSGINTLIRSAFAGESSVKEVEKHYADFTAYSPSKGKGISLEDGVMTFSGGGSIYSVCDGMVEKVAENAGKLDISIKYSSSFSALISGADYAYYTQGDSVYSSVPVCYSHGGDVKVYLYNDGKLLTNYTVDNGRIVWQS